MSRLATSNYYFVSRLKTEPKNISDMPKPYKENNTTSGLKFYNDVITITMR